VLSIDTIWPARFEKIKNCIQLSGADLYCLQEVDHYPEYDSFLESIGFKSVYMQRPTRNDGCLIAFDKHKLELCKIDEVYFDYQFV